MNKIGVEEQKRIQLDVLSVVDRFCRENDINYSLGCGTMLGAARHKGFIPWDDDIDIYLFRKEYNKLISLYPDVVDDVKIASLERDVKWDKSFSKAYNAMTLVKDGGNSYKVGVGIDVFPIDKVPEDENEWISYDRKRRHYQRIYELKNSMLFRKGRPMWKYLFLPFTKLLLLPFSSRDIAKFLDRYAQKYDEIESEDVFECCQGIVLKHKFKRSTLENVMDMPFEDRMFKGMVDYDDYLTNVYGDWRKLPPVEKRTSHHLYNAWWK